MKPLTTITDPRLVKALAHPLRLRILSVLEERTASPKEISDEVDAPLTHVSYHVRQLAELGVIKLVRTRQVRGAIEHHYRLEARPSITDEAWRQAPEIAKQALVGAVLGQVSTQVNAAAAEAGFSRDGARLSRLPLELDEEGWREASRALQQLATELERIQKDARTRTRHANDRGRAMAVLMLFESAAQAHADPSAPRGRRRRGNKTKRAK
ncbi:MAG: helix-turn-helix domain-containing protein [Thermoleophilaceae bacterium]